MIPLNRIPVLLIASTLAVIGLVYFQAEWMRYSRQLSDEIFNRQVSMALCSAVEASGGQLCSGKSVSCEQACPETGIPALSGTLALDTAFKANLHRALKEQGIDLDFYIPVPDGTVSQLLTQGGQQQPQCAMMVTASDSMDTSNFTHLAFPGKETFMMGKMRFMIIAFVLILLFTAVVLWYANWSLMKQKRLLETNVDFFNNMAHEFRTPLTNVSLATNLLVKKHKDLKDNQIVGIIRRENSKLLAQVERVLHLARMENGDYSLQKEQVNLKALVQSVCEEMGMQIEERSASVQFDDIPNTFEVFGDRLHLGNVFRNLLDNALKYSCVNPEIRISAQEQAEGVLIWVQDNGVGIPDSQCGHIFEKFQRANQGNLHEQKGFGLGLAYVKSMVELHKGFIRVSSELNKGSRFEVFLPA